MINVVDGARGRNRTADTVIFSHVLYQLSYPGLAGGGAREGRLRRGSAPMAKHGGLGKPQDDRFFQPAASSSSGRSAGFPGMA